DGQGRAVGERAVGGGAGHGDVRRDGVGGVDGEVVEVGPHGVDVAADDRAGEGGVTVVERVVEGGSQQRPERPGRVVGTGGGQDLQGLRDQGDQVVGAVGETGVVEGAFVLGHPHRAAAQVGDQALGQLAL